MAAGQTSGTLEISNEVADVDKTAVLYEKPARMACGVNGFQKKVVIEDNNSLRTRQWSQEAARDRPNASRMLSAIRCP